MSSLKRFIWAHFRWTSLIFLSCFLIGLVINLWIWGKSFAHHPTFSLAEIPNILTLIPSTLLLLYYLMFSILLPLPVAFIIEFVVYLLRKITQNEHKSFKAYLWTHFRYTSILLLLYLSLCVVAVFWDILQVPDLFQKLTWSGIVISLMSSTIMSIILFIPFILLPLILTFRIDSAISRKKETPNIPESTADF